MHSRALAVESVCLLLKRGAPSYLIASRLALAYNGPTGFSFPAFNRVKEDFLHAG